MALLFMPSMRLDGVGHVREIYKVEPPKTNNDRKINSMYHMHTLEAPNVCMWYIVLVL